MNEAQVLDAMRGPIRELCKPVRAQKLARDAPLDAEAPRSTMELEMRLGTVTPLNQFAAGVDNEWFDALIRRLDASQKWFSVSPWHEYEDVTFHDAQGVPVRQTVVANCASCKLDLLYTQKQSLLKVTLAAVSECMCCNGVDAVRLALSQETSLSASGLPRVVVPLHVRIKRRRSYTLQCTTIPKSFWRYDCTQCWSGATKEQAAKSQRNEKPVCEVEVEWIPPPGVDPADFDTDHVTKSMLQRVQHLSDIRGVGIVGDESRCVASGPSINS